MDNRLLVDLEASRRAKRPMTNVGCRRRAMLNARKSFALAIFMLSVASLNADLTEELRNDPRMAPGVISVSPSVLYDEIREARAKANEGSSGMGSEGGADVFYRVYAERLRLDTDSKFPGAAKFRTDFLNVFELLNSFLATAAGGGTGFGHEAERLPAKVEWDLYDGAAHGYEFYERGYSLDDLRAIAVILAKAKVEPPNRPAPRLEEFDAALKQLSHVEKLMPQNMKLYFRSRLMRYIANEL